MKIGCCLPGGSFMPQGKAEVVTPSEILLAGYEVTKSVGYDYAESSVGMVMKLTEEEVELLAAKREKGEFEIQACNSFIPGTYQIADPEQLPALKEYVTEAMRRMELLGVQVVVFGSGAARKLPGVDPMKELAAIDAFLKMANEQAAAHHITIVIEPLNTGETNIFNSVSAGASMCRRLNLSNVKLLADCYHTHCENENLYAIEENADILRHVHVAEPPERICPGKNGGAYVREFSEHLHRAGYTERVSIECGYADFEKDIEGSYPLMRELFS